MKKLIGMTIISCMLMITSVSGGQLITGGWQTTENPAVTDEVREAFDKAMAGYSEAEYEAIDLLATQIVSGVNYCFLCRDVTDETSGYAFVYVYENLGGDAEVLDVQPIAIGVQDVEEEASVSVSKDEYEMGETWTVDGQWELTVDSVEETADRNEYSEKEPAAVYIVTFTYTNIGYEDDFMDGLYFLMDDQIVDAANKMGYSYPGDITLYPQEAPIGATCTGQVCIGVDNPGPFKLYVDAYDGNDEHQKAVFAVGAE